MGQMYEIRDPETDKLLMTIEGDSPEDASANYDDYVAKQEGQSKWPTAEQVQEKMTDSLISSIPIPGAPLLVNTIKDVAGSFGPTEKGKEMLSAQGPGSALWDLIKAGSANVGNTLSMGTMPAALARSGRHQMDADIAKSREYLGVGGDLALSQGVGMLNPLTKLLPFTRAAGEFGPGAWKAVQRIAAGGADDMWTEALNSTIRGEGYGWDDMYDSVKNSVLTGGLIESVLGIKRAGGRAVVPKRVREVDDAVAVMERERDASGVKRTPRDYVRDVMPQGWSEMINRMSGLAPREHAMIQKQASDRYYDTAARVKAEAESVYGKPLAPDKKGKATAQELRDEAFGHSPEYLPAFTANPTLPNKIRRQLDLGEVNDQGKPIKTGVSIPKGYEAAIGEPKAYKDFDTARAEAQDYADRLARKQGRPGPPTETEVFWYTIRNLESKGGNAQETGEHLRKIFRNQFTDVGKIIDAQATAHGASRGALAGGNVWNDRNELNEPETKRALATPEGRDAFERAALSDVVSGAQQGKPGSKLMSPSPDKRQTAELVLGSQRGKQLMDALQREWDKIAHDETIVKHKSGSKIDLSKPQGLIRKSAGAAARAAAGFVTGGPGGLIWALPHIANRLKDPRDVMSPTLAQDLTRLSGEKDLPARRKKNAAETKGNMGFTTPAIMNTSRQERDERRYQRARDKELSEKFLRKNRGDEQ